MAFHFKHVTSDSDSNHAGSLSFFYYDIERTTQQKSSRVQTISMALKICFYEHVLLSTNTWEKPFVECKALWPLHKLNFIYLNDSLKSWACDWKYTYASLNLYLAFIALWLIYSAHIYIYIYICNYYNFFMKGLTTVVISMSTNLNV